MKGKGREGTQSHKTLYFIYLWGGHRWANSHKIRRACSPSNVINMSSFCYIKFSGVSDLQGAKSPFSHHAKFRENSDI